MASDAPSIALPAAARVHRPPPGGGKEPAAAMHGECGSALAISRALKAGRREGSVSNWVVRFFRHCGESRNLRAAMDSSFRRNDGSIPKPPEKKHYPTDGTPFQAL